MLKSGKAIECPTYDYTIHNRAEEIDAPSSRGKVIVVEGILIFVKQDVLSDRDGHQASLSTQTRTCAFAGVSAATSKNAGGAIDSVIDQYLTTVKPMHEQFVEPSKKNANLIVPEGGKNLIALEMIINRIQKSHRHGIRLFAAQSAPLFSADCAEKRGAISGCGKLTGLFSYAMMMLLNMGKCCYVHSLCSCL